VKVLDLFSGIGGFSLGLERAGMETVAFCEIEEYPRKVLAKHWPDIPIYDDVRTLTKERLEADGIRSIDVICGGFPCQDISAAGKQAGISDGTRSGLWSECARLLGELRPRYAIFENVTALISGDQGRWFQRVLWDISEVGYDAEWHCIPASELGAHHHRDRVWIIAYPKRITGRADAGAQSQASEERQELQQENGESLPGNTKPVCSDVAHANDTRYTTLKDEINTVGAKIKQEWDKQSQPKSSRCSCWEIEPQVGRVANGIPNQSHRLRALGNAVVPQIPEIIGRAIMAIDYSGVV